MWDELGDCEETSSRKPRSSKQKILTIDMLEVQGTGISIKMKILKVKVMRFQRGMRTNFDVYYTICMLNFDK